MNIHELRRYCENTVQARKQGQEMSFADMVGLLPAHGGNRPFASETMLRFMAEFLDEHAAILAEPVTSRQ